MEHEQNGELFEAIQKYRKAINLVPDIEFKAHEHNLRRRNVPSQPVTENEPSKNFGFLSKIYTQYHKMC